MNLTTHLQTLYPTLFHAATNPPFLSAEGAGTLPKPLLSVWLSQDRLYAHAYIQFIGALLAKISIPAHPNAAETIESRTVSVLIDALVNIKREIAGFEDTARRFGLDLAAPPAPPSSTNSDHDVDEYRDEDGDEDGDKKEGRVSPTPVTRAYIDLFMSASSPSATLLEGLAVLWATEFSYLRAWQGAAVIARDVQRDTDTALDADGGAARGYFIPSWTSEEFESFVGDIELVVDELYALVGGGSGEGDVLGRCRVWWRQVLWLEKRFWPEV